MNGGPRRRPRPVERGMGAGKETQARDKANGKTLAKAKANGSPGRSVGALGLEAETKMW